ncbi:TPA: Crp/Fnr family transcriptional regulator [Streptococcus suis]|uniref:Crp/Fnr family transcriptional regulator n=1 Tax=Streptococcus TaxID=1301 RepID=UPI001961EF38|nr:MULTISPECIES: Crp/Fnr family transcriptional regulator [Streptococcus]MBM7268096.1 Crp/Fnr family transcriptional regulator [Streptococcus suis]MBY0753242.1 Crp/Fnr family transcriptional regulator [Streptococcus sp. 2018037]HEM3635714.1 Crp/Fnr family transcriptional regulator [Streptococcus suis]HEM6183439.1 Crp/Fnr family transcriptional regulator [Streptococcus suis]
MSILDELFQHEDIQPHLIYKEIKAKDYLLDEGQVSHMIYLVKSGALRLWHNHDGKDITIQFFFEGDSVSSLESFLTKTESIYSLQAIEDTVVYCLNRQLFETFLLEHPEYYHSLTILLSQKMIKYNHLFLSRIKNSPEQRFLELVQEKSDLLWRVPDIYLSSYLGITPVSLSRIKKRLT